MTIDAWIELARGPLFRIALAICVLGLLYRVGVALAQVVGAWRRAGDRRLPVTDIANATVGWIFPRRLLRQRPLYSAASLLFHVGVIVVPLFLAGHVALADGFLPAWWPTLGATSADALTVAALLALAMLLVGRIVSVAARRLTRGQDVLVLLVLLLTVGFGFAAAHPTLSPFAGRTMVLLHILLGDLVLILIPLSKISHCVLYPFTQLVFQLGWHFPAETGRHVAVALGKEGEPV